MAIMPHFNLHQPTKIEEALDLISMYRASVQLIAGGTDIVPRMRAGVLEVQELVSLTRVQGLNRITYLDGDGLVIGAGARISDVGEHPDVRKYYPGLAHACSVMATVQIRNMGTVAGNVANAAPSGDTLAPLLAYNAKVVLVERGGRRQVELTDFFTGPGQTVMEPHEMIEAIRVPGPPRSCGSAYQRISARSKVDMAAVGVAGFLALDMDGKIMGIRLALASVAPTPVRCPEAEAMLEGQIPNPELLKKAGAACVRAAKPISDVRASANYRRLMVQVLAQRVVAQCADMAKGGAK